MKEQAINMIENLSGFLDSIKSVALHPYGNGINVEKVITDLQDYVKDLKEAVEKIDEVSVDFEGEPDSEENSK